ncbi:MAG TPA: pitrilysin family protein [Solirubrobacteraceae bacterium]|nr:pitrilysin family protein [Solirubrobacteraceae bacterium]
MAKPASGSHRLTELAGGVRVITEQVPSVRSVAVGMWIANGSADEDDERAGISHLLEHMLFRGTPSLTSREIDETFDAMGAEINAATDKETTLLYSRVVDSHVERAFTVLAEMLATPAFEDLATERQVVLEEIAMYEDDAQDRVFELLSETLYGDGPLGRPVIGRAATVAAIDEQRLRAFHDERYTARRVVVAAAGALEHEQIVALAERHLATLAPGPDGAGEPAAGELAPTTTAFFEKETEQCHMCVGGAGLARSDERRFALRVLEAILGGTSSSRLFQEIRERAGLAYSVFTFSNLHARVGDVGIYLGTRPDNVPRALELLRAELARLAGDGVTVEELNRAKENLKGRVALSQESVSAHMNRIGSALLLDLPVLTLEETIARIERVTHTGVCELGAELYAPERLTVVGVGPDSAEFEAAVRPAAAAGGGR